MDTPVLLVGFNRPDRLANLVDELRAVKPERVYLAVDGPRGHVPGEIELVAASRDVAGRVDWPCDVRTLFRDENLGCGRGVSGAITWLFGHEERGIVLEDDLRPDATFFPYAGELLDRYEHDDRVFAVSGCTYVPPAELESTDSYRFARLTHIWGWATWRRSWEQYEHDLRGWRRRLPAPRLWEASGRSPVGYAYWSGMFDLMARQAVDTWDFQLAYAAFRTGGLTATPNVNLVDNVGFAADSTHTEEAPDYLLPAEPMRFPLRHPQRVAPDDEADDWTRRHVMGATLPGMAAQAGRFARRTWRRRRGG